MYIVRHNGVHYGPFLHHEAKAFARMPDVAPCILPLVLPGAELDGLGSLQFELDDDDRFREHRDATKTDTLLGFAAVSLAYVSAERTERVLVQWELKQLWALNRQMQGAVESLMHHAQNAVNNPTPETLIALRKALWRNRGYDDVHPRYKHIPW